MEFGSNESKQKEESSGGIIAGICSKFELVIWRVLVILESGDSSVITRWTVDQEVVGSDQTDIRNKMLYHARSLSRIIPEIR